MDYIADFQSRDDLLSRYGHNALLLYALQRRFEIPDIISVASDALTDGSDDKKCDLIYVDRGNGIAVIAQSYMKQHFQESDLAPQNKACDLNTAAAWVFTQNAEDVPEQIREQVRDLQDAIKESEVNIVYFWFVHNLNEKNNPKVKEELVTMQASALALSKNAFCGKDIEICAVEVGNETIEKWYRDSSKQITVTETIQVDAPKVGFELQGEKWKAYITAVTAKWLKKYYKVYDKDLFSGNPRTYLGAGKKKNKINLGIIETIQQEPDNFWPYNNGVTALVNDYNIVQDSETEEEHLFVSGITIINGAQTTGAISSVENLGDALVPIRFIVCRDINIIGNIIDNNNKQNEILPSDLRSNDKTQNRLRAEFEKYDKLYYSGGRRSDMRPRSREVLDPFVVAQALLAFHGDCVTAYNSKNDLWSEDRLYSAIFPDNLTAEHIIFTYSLSRSIDAYKLELKQKGDRRTAPEEKQHKFLSRRGAKMLLIFTISKCMEGIVNNKIRDSWSLTFKVNTNFDNIVQLWKCVIKLVLPLTAQHSEVALVDGLKSKEQSENSADEVMGLFTAI